MGLGDFLFKEKEEKYLKQIENLQNKLKKQEEEISQLKYDLEVVTQERDNRISGKQLEIFEIFSPLFINVAISQSNFPLLKSKNLCFASSKFLVSLGISLKSSSLR